MREAILYSEGDEGGVDCYLCSHRCHIQDGKTGFCRVRENRSGTLYSLVYGRAVTRSVEWIEKKPLYHFKPGSRSYSLATPGCNFRCPWCQNWQISTTEDGDDFSNIPQVPPPELVQSARQEDCQSLCYTYTEPTIFMEYALDTARLAREEGLANLFVTNGYQTPEAVEEMTGLIDAANVDLKSFSDEFYRNNCGARLQPVLDSVRQMHENGIHVEVTTLVVPDLNDSEAELREIARFLADISPDIVWHVSRFHPDYEASDMSPTPRATIEMALEAGQQEGLRYVYPGNILLPGAYTTSCPDCGQAVIERAGMGSVDIRLEDGACPRCGTELPIVT